MGEMRDGGTADADAPRILSLHVGLPVALGTEGAADPMDRPWTTGFLKHPVDGPLWLGVTNLAGDGQADRRHHGGPDKAVCVYPAAHYPFWRAALGLPLPFGAFGENVALAAMDERGVSIGDVFAVGGARVQVTQPRQPCWKLARRWRVRDLAARVQETGFTGWYFRVLEEGEVRAGLPLVRLDRPYAAWTVARANEVMHRRRDDRDAAAALAACPALSESWRHTLTVRAATGASPDPSPRLTGANEG
jgi:MOSC domain-containing protein YiiM